MQNEFDAPAPGRFCRLQIMAFLVLNLLGSCVHTSPSQHVSQPQVNPLAQQLSTEPAQITASNS
ncbi:hypothetical protein [Rheinheimera tilapiae]|uniref:Uncharacterized protein n=1 Tax=Rheinheimera tilapiae TaxID=875043 RepID=A0ABV6BFD1_9GAMM